MITYFIQAVSGGPIKIGVTSQDVVSRLKNLQTGSPAPLTVIGVINGNVERELHGKFNSQRLHGEWFDLSEELLAFIRKNATAVSCVEAAEVPLSLNGKPVSINNALTRPRSVESMFDAVIEQSEDMWEQVVDGWNWDAIGGVSDEEMNEVIELEESGEDPDTEFPRHIISGLVSLVVGEPFVEAIGINEGAGLFCLICGPCNSHRRFHLLEDVADCAALFDSWTDAMAFVAVFPDRDKLVGVDLVYLGISGTRENGHLFDAKEWIGSHHG